MNRETFYQEIGNIDDDLIQAAHVAHKQKNPKFLLYRIVKIAACLCLLCSGILWALQRDSIYIHKISMPAALKAMIPTETDSKTVSLTYQELLSYYGIEHLPETLGEALQKTKQSYFVLYQDQEGTILYDTNRFYYSSPDKSQSLSIALAKAGKSSQIFHENKKLSKISGFSVLLAEVPDSTAYWAAFEMHDISFQLLFEGLSEEAFIHAVKEFILFIK